MANTIVIFKSSFRFSSRDVEAGKGYKCPLNFSKYFMQHQLTTGPSIETRPSTTQKGWISSFRKIQVGLAELKAFLNIRDEQTH